MEGHVILKKVELSLELDESLPAIHGQRSKLEQVFLNLVINAAEAMEGQGSLEITTSQEPRERTVRVTVADNGPGMDEEVAARIFEPFYTTKGRGRGTGLGLSISHGIVKQHGGRLELDTAPGRGTRITVVLPQDAAAPAWSPKGD
jgi:signal transduction histidine kinase